jgi:hypothetical protein
MDEPRSLPEVGARFFVKEYISVQHAKLPANDTEINHIDKDMYDANARQTIHPARWTTPKPIKTLSAFVATFSSGDKGVESCFLKSKKSTPSAVKPDKSVGSHITDRYSAKPIPQTAER